MWCSQEVIVFMGIQYGFQQQIGKGCKVRPRDVVVRVVSVLRTSTVLLVGNTIPAGCTLESRTHNLRSICPCAPRGGKSSGLQANASAHAMCPMPTTKVRILDLSPSVGTLEDLLFCPEKFQQQMGKRVPGHAGENGLKLPTCVCFDVIFSQYCSCRAQTTQQTVCSSAFSMISGLLAQG